MKSDWIHACKEGWAVIITAALLSVAVFYPLTRGYENISELGDWIGGVASAIAFLWLVAGYNIQRRELSLQYEELKLQRQALEQQVAEMHKATKISRDNARATLRAAEATEQTIAQTQVSAQAAIKSADAAELSARAAISMELPLLHVMQVQADGPTQTWLGSSSLLPVISIKNFGRTTAFIFDIIVNIAVGAKARNKAYRNLTMSQNPEVLEPKKTLDYKEYFLDLEFKLTKDDIDKIISEKKYLYLYGVIKYKDFLDNQHETGFSYFWSEMNKKFLLDSSKEFDYKN